MRIRKLARGPDPASLGFGGDAGATSGVSAVLASLEVDCGGGRIAGRTKGGADSPGRAPGGRIGRVGAAGDAPGDGTVSVTPSEATTEFSTDEERARSL
jgi:hypothetical protein